MIKFLLLSFMLVGCFDKELGPEATLRTFVEKRFGEKVSRDYLLDRVTGKMEQTLQNISEDDFKNYADLTKIRLTKFEILSKSCSGQKCFITYMVSYESSEKDSVKKFKSDVKKIAEMVEVDGRWLISDVSNLKTYHESMEVLHPMD